MNAKSFILIIALSCSILSIVPARAQEAQESETLQPQTHCPIMGGAVNPKLYVDARGQRIKVCCPACIPVVKKAPEAALAKLQEKNQYAESLQTVCPIMGNKINKNLYVEYKGRRLYVCCKPCIKTMEANPAKYAEMIAAQAGETDSTTKSAGKGMGTMMHHGMKGMQGMQGKKAGIMQMTCPMMGNKINKSLYADVKGYRVYVCCKPCIARVKADPDGALDRIRKKGETPYPAPTADGGMSNGHK